MRRLLPLLLLVVACGEPAPEAPAPEAAADPAPAVVLRLTEAEYNRAVADLLQTDVAPWRFPPEFALDGFTGRFATQAPSDALLEELRLAAVAASTAVPDSPAFVCEDTDADCLRSALLAFADRAWRRPLDEAAAGRLGALFDDLAAASDPLLAARLGVQAVLQSPRFLYRIELGVPTGDDGATVPLDPWELAARLSFFLWDTVPDEPLRALAADGSLTNPAVLETQARRMLDDARARDAVVAFHREWLDVDGIDALVPDPDVHFPEAGIEDAYIRAITNTRRVMKAEIDQYVTHTLLVDPSAGSLGDLLTATTAWVGPQTAAGYGVDYDTDGIDLASVWVEGLAEEQIELRPVRLPPEQRAGVLTLAGVMAARSHAVHPSPVHRGLLVLDRLLCDRPENPPAGAVSQAPPDDVDAESTNRERLAAATSSTDCIGCHASINALGFAFERYDAVGRWREDDFGSPLDTTGSLGTLAFDDAVRLSAELAALDPVHGCYAERWLTHALGRAPVAADGPDALVDGFLLDGGDVRGLLVAIVMSEAFRSRSAEGAP